MYITLGFKWLYESFCPTLAFATADRDEARNPQRFIHVTVLPTSPSARRENGRRITSCILLLA